MRWALTLLLLAPLLLGAGVKRFIGVWEPWAFDILVNAVSLNPTLDSFSNLCSEWEGPFTVLAGDEAESCFWPEDNTTVVHEVWIMARAAADFTTSEECTVDFLHNGVAVAWMQTKTRLAITTCERSSLTGGMVLEIFDYCLQRNPANPVTLVSGDEVAIAWQGDNCDAMTSALMSFRGWRKRR